MDEISNGRQWHSGKIAFIRCLGKPSLGIGKGRGGLKQKISHQELLGKCAVIKPKHGVRFQGGSAMEKTGAFMVLVLLLQNCLLTS